MAWKKYSRKSTTKTNKPKQVKIYSRKVDRGGIYIGEENWMLELSSDPAFPGRFDDLGYVELGASKANIQKIGNERYRENLGIRRHAMQMQGDEMATVNVGRFLPNGY